MSDANDFTHGYPARGGRHSRRENHEPRQRRIDGLMLAAKRPHASLLDMNVGARRDLRAKLEECRITLDCLAGYTNFTADAEHPEIPHREMQIHYVGELCRLAVALGGRVVRIFTGYEHAASDSRAGT